MNRLQTAATLTLCAHIFLQAHDAHRDLHSFPTRRSSDLDVQAAAYAYAWQRVIRNPNIDAFILHRHVDHAHEGGLNLGLWTDRKSTRLNSSHSQISYAVFCLKKKKNKQTTNTHKR